MIFRITRVSDFGEEKPCEEAVEGTYVVTDTRSVDDPEKLRYRGGPEDWRNNGYNHRVEGGHIKREIERKGWLIEINNVDDLISLCQKYGHSLIFDATENNREINIYDGYVE